MITRLYYLLPLVCRGYPNDGESNGKERRTWNMKWKQGFRPEGLPGFTGLNLQAGFKVCTEDVQVYRYGNREQVRVQGSGVRSAVKGGGFRGFVFH